MRSIFCSAMFVIICATSSAQGVAINQSGATADSSAILDLQSTTSGLLVPRMSSGQRQAIQDPAVGLMVYDLDKNSFWCYAGAEWIEIMAGAAAVVSDSDGDTRIHVEKNADEDIIRFDIAGQEQWRIRDGALEQANSSNIAIGDSSLWSNISSGGNVSIGSRAMLSNTFGGRNVSIGWYALHFNTIGSDTTALGGLALHRNVTGDWNTAIGANALFAANSGDNNVAIGRNALYSNEAGSNNIAIGFNAHFNNTSGHENIAIGTRAMNQNDSGHTNVAIGDSSLRLNTVGSYNVAMGSKALSSNTLGAYNTAIGYMTLAESTVATDNTAVGASALSNSLAGGNTAVGSGALTSNESGQSNTAMGFGTLWSNTIGGWNVAVGSYALNDNSTGQFNTSIGSRALTKNTEGSNNTAIGRQSQESTTVGYENTSIGAEAMGGVTLGFRNTAVGYNSLDNITVGQNNTAIGYNADASAVNLVNATAIGANALVSKSNALVLGSSSIDVGIGVSSPNEHLEVGGDGRVFFGNGAGASRQGVLIDGGSPRIEAYDYGGATGMDLVINTVGNGNVGIRNWNPTVALDVTGSIEYTGTITDVSDERLKENILPVSDALESLIALTAYTYEMKGDPEQKREYGLMAQEVQSVFPEMVTTVDEEQGYLGVSYIQLIPVLVAAIRELAEENEALRSRLNSLAGK